MELSKEDWDWINERLDGIATQLIVEGGDRPIAEIAEEYRRCNASLIGIAKRSNVFWR